MKNIGSASGAGGLTHRVAGDWLRVAPDRLTEYKKDWPKGNGKWKDII